MKEIYKEVYILLKNEDIIKSYRIFVLDIIYDALTSKGKFLEEYFNSYN